MKRRTCVRMDELNKKQRKELNSRIKDTVENYSKEIQQDQESED